MYQVLSESVHLLLLPDLYRYDLKFSHPSTCGLAVAVKLGVSPGTMLVRMAGAELFTIQAARLLSRILSFCTSPNYSKLDPSDVEYDRS